MRVGLMKRTATLIGSASAGCLLGMALPAWAETSEVPTSAIRTVSENAFEASSYSILPDVLPRTKASKLAPKKSARVVMTPRETSSAKPVMNAPASESFEPKLPVITPRVMKTPSPVKTTLLPAPLRQKTSPLEPQQFELPKVVNTTQAKRVEPQHFELPKVVNITKAPETPTLWTPPIEGLGLPETEPQPLENSIAVPQPGPVLKASANAVTPWKTTRGADRETSSDPKSVVHVSTPESASLNTKEMSWRLDGYCPVTLRDHQKLTAGQPELLAEWEGTPFRFASQTAKDTFLKDPTAYLPANSGNDAVLAQTGQKVPGTLEHAAWYRGKLYLFQSAETRQTFEAQREKFAKN